MIRLSITDRSKCHDRAEPVIGRCGAQRDRARLVPANGEKPLGIDLWDLGQHKINCATRIDRAGLVCDELFDSGFESRLGFLAEQLVIQDGKTSADIRREVLILFELGHII